MQFDFFATVVDLSKVFKWLYDVPGMRFVESYSKPDRPNRWFDDWPELEAHLQAGFRNIAAWPSYVGGVPLSERIIFIPEIQQKLGAIGRTALHSPAFIHYDWLGEVNGCLGASSLRCWSEKGAKQRSFLPQDMIAGIDWKQFRSVFRKVQRQIRKSASHKLHAAPVMSDAHSQLLQGEIKLWGWGNEVLASSDFLQPT